VAVMWNCQRRKADHASVDSLTVDNSSQVTAPLLARQRRAIRLPVLGDRASCLVGVIRVACPGLSIDAVHAAPLRVSLMASTVQLPRPPFGPCHLARCTSRGARRSGMA
jgi:hypothetical protein